MLSMTLNLIGLGLWDEKDISLKGLETAKKCKKIYLEKYTSVMFGTTLGKLEALFGKKVIPLDRKAVEQTKTYLQEAREQEIALLVGGDPTVATTHTEIILEAKKEGINTKIVHASSIHSSLSESGLFTYKFGPSCSIPFPQEGFEPESFYGIITKNMKNGSHTAVFLDLKPEEDRYMTINQALQTLLDIAKKRNNEINMDTIAVGFARMGSEDRIIKAGKISELLNQDFGTPMHILVIPGELHFIEKEALNTS